MRKPPRLAQILADPQSIALPADPHRLVAAWMELDRQNQERARKENRYVPAKDEDSVLGRRRLRIHDALFKAAEAKGYAVSQEQHDLHSAWITITGQKVSWKLREQSRPRREPFSKAELKEPQNIARGIPTTTVSVPTGLLTFAVSTDCYSRKTHLSERPHSPFESRIDQMLSKLETFAEVVRLRDEEHERWDRERREKERRGNRRRRLKAMEEARWEFLCEMTKDWQQAEALRAFINAVEKGLTVQRPARATAWLEWARARANWLDPFAGGEASVLGEIVRWRYEPDPSEYQLSVWELGTEEED